MRYVYRVLIELQVMFLGFFNFAVLFSQAQGFDVLLYKNYFLDLSKNACLRFCRKLQMSSVARLMEVIVVIVCIVRFTTIALRVVTPNCVRLSALSINNKSCVIVHVNHIRLVAPKV